MKTDKIKIGDVLPYVKDEKLICPICGREMVLFGDCGSWDLEQHICRGTETNPGCQCVVECKVNYKLERRKAPEPASIEILSVYA